MQMPTERNGGDRSENQRDQIDENLKRVFDSTLREPLPDKLVELLERLKKGRGK